MSISRTENDYYGKISRIYFKEAFQRLGVKLVVVSCAPSMCSNYSKSGSTDGELARSINYEQYAPHLIRVKQPHLAVKLSVFSKNKTLNLNEPSDFFNTNYKVAFNFGYVVLEDWFGRIKNQVTIVRVEHWKQGLFRLMNDEVDVFVGVEKTIEGEIQKQHYVGIKNVGSLVTLPMYTFLRKEHAQLALDLVSVIKEMEEDERLVHIEGVKTIV